MSASEEEVEEAAELMQQHLTGQGSVGHAGATTDRARSLMGVSAGVVASGQHDSAPGAGCAAGD